MALEVNIQRNKDVSLWREYKDTEGNVLAEFKIRGIGYKPYQVALERANNQISSKGFDVAKATAEDKLFHELVLEAVASHLIEDWKGVVFVEEGPEGELVKTEPTFNGENAFKLLNMGDLGVSIWSFIRTESEKIQAEANQYRDDVVGKSSASTSGQSSAQKKKRATTVKSKAQSQKL
ncbi:MULTISPECIES: hypothetical protein [Acinetobacter calcoaceticus/baumannii complex]|uniref:hypothetical protein n=1 Tax=Acinetobacter calcoaceticus/baumannii complex TaxID=909768 RepID=UPI000DE75B24|nr:hypothetical protein [Acinetobacter baumannii]MBI1415316.1 hypothetical protein [Acinetobacter baumannii]MBI1429314.1 hypothetical protein [Acinetobacter baumannii]MCJ9178396.1 hypothetical protein [Acinetobacter baumannii]MCJ9182393.1 hypothetical protein [Acinetobacter baumannii]MCJ9189690.1 hypothetical protein [Acinetobacter baumannii]